MKKLAHRNKKAAVSIGKGKVWTENSACTFSSGSASGCGGFVVAHCCRQDNKLKFNREFAYSTHSTHKYIIPESRLSYANLFRSWKRKKVEKK